MANAKYVHDAFGMGIIVPIIQDKLSDSNDLNNYRGITLIPVISKLFEVLVLDIFQDYLITSNLQFGLKCNSGCANGIFVMSETIKYYLKNGGSIISAALDLRKAFDKVNHFKLLTCLIDRRVPLWVVATSSNWYLKSFVNVVQ